MQFLCVSHTRTTYLEIILFPSANIQDAMTATTYHLCTQNDQNEYDENGVHFHSKYFFRNLYSKLEPLEHQTLVSF